MESTYITSAMKAEQLQPMELPEIALFGRSNTGKSTLINKLLCRKNLAFYSKFPGRTQMINFFKVNNSVIFADIPGFGFSKAARTVAKNWEGLINAYVKRPNIKEFLFLHDCRRALTDEDFELMFLLGRQLPLVVILTKSDKLNRSNGIRKKNETKRLLEEKGINFKEVTLISSLKNSGIAELQSQLLN